MNSVTKTATATLAALTCLSPFVVFLALPMFDGGIFRQSETVAAGLHAVAAVAAALLMALTVTDPTRVAGALRAPVLALGAIGLAGLATLPFAGDPAMSLHGSLESGVGALWYLEAAILAASASVAWAHLPRWRPVMASAPALSVAACGILQAARFHWDGELLATYDFPEYLGIDALLAAVPLLALPGRAAKASAVALAVGGALMAGNRSTGLAILAAVAAYAALRRWPARTPSLPAMAVGATLAIAALMAVGAPALEALAERSAPATSAADVLSKAPIDRISIQTKPYGTLWDRSVSARLLIHDVLAHPAELAFGSGFGSFERVSRMDNRLAPGRRMVAPSDTASVAYWDGDQKARFHVHNGLYEALLSGGVLAALAWLALAWSAGRGEGRDRLAARVALVAALAVGCSLWFLVNAAAPLLAMAVAAACARQDPGTRAPVRSAAAAGLTLGCAALTLATAAAAAVTGVAVGGERLERAFVPVFSIGSKPICQGYEAVSLPNAQINRELYGMLIRRIATAGDQAPMELALRQANLTNFSCMMREYAKAGDSMALLASLKARADLSDMLGATNPVMASILGPDYRFWRDDLDLALHAAPLRTDLVMPYVQWLQSNGRKDDVKAAVAHFAPAVPAGDPVRPWLAAQADQASDDPAGYRVHIREAFDAGMANLVVVPKGQAESVLKAER